MGVLVHFLPLAPHNYIYPSHSMMPSIRSIDRHTSNITILIIIKKESKGSLLSIVVEGIGTSEETLRVLRVLGCLIETK